MRTRGLYEHRGWIEAYLEGPKTLEELQAAVSDPRPGYDIHHIVERRPAVAEGYPESWVDGPDNLVRIPRFKHWEINAWYSAKHPNFSDQSPRDYLRGKDWPEKRRVGLKALVLFGVLKL